MAASPPKRGGPIWRSREKYTNTTIIYQPSAQRAQRHRHTQTDAHTHIHAYIHSEYGTTHWATIPPRSLRVFPEKHQTGSRCSPPFRFALHSFSPRSQQLTQRRLTLVRVLVPYTHARAEINKQSNNLCPASSGKGKTRRTQKARE